MMQRLLRPAATQRRYVSYLPQPKHYDSQRQADLKHAVDNVIKYDPAGHLPGVILGRLPEKNNIMQVSYFAVRSFWAETGLRFINSSYTKSKSLISPADQLEWWKRGIDSVFSNESSEEFGKHPTLRLLKSIQQTENVNWTRCHFDDVLEGRRKDLDIKQYETLDELVQHAEHSCGSLLQLVLESGDITATDAPAAHQAAKLVGICHGLTNALRTSIPVVSVTGRLIIPAELTTRYGVKSPRYLLSALGQGDKKCLEAMQMAVKDIVDEARNRLQQARELKPQIIASLGNSNNDANKAMAVLLPGLASETFLNRLARYQHELTNRDLRNVGLIEHAACSMRIISAYLQKTY